MKALAWILGLLFLLLAAGAAVTNAIAALPLVVGACALLPPVWSRLPALSRLPSARRLRVLIVVLCSGVFFVIAAQRGGQLQAEASRRRHEEWQLAKPEVLRNVRAASAARHYQEALDAGEAFRDIGDAELDAALSEARRQIDIPALLKRVEATEDLAKRRDLLARVVELDPGNREWRDRLSSVDQALALQATAAKRREQLRPIFSGWDGSVRSLVTSVKASMHNPDSFEHVKTTYVDAGDHLEVAMTFRGTNAFGGIVTNRIVADIDLAGRIMRIKSRD